MTNNLIGNVQTHARTVGSIHTQTQNSSGPTVFYGKVANLQKWAERLQPGEAADLIPELVKLGEEIQQASADRAALACCRQSKHCGFTRRRCAKFSS